MSELPAIDSHWDYRDPEGSERRFEAALAYPILARDPWFPATEGERLERTGGWRRGRPDAEERGGAMAKVNEGRLVRIRPIHEDDLPTMDAWKLDSEALSGFDTPAIRSPEISRRRLEKDGFLDPDCTVLAVETLDDRRLVGRVGFFRDSPVYETMVRTMSLVGSPADRGRGYATEARMLLVSYVFLSTEVERVYSETEEGNAPARRSLEKCGMRFEGVLRHLFYDRGRWSDIAVLSILRAEWAASDLYRDYREPFLRPWFEDRAGG